jgi:hypothetical protein
MKTKATTLAERFGFQDKDLATPKHDELFCWLFDKKNVREMINTIGFFKDNYNLRTRIHWEERHNPKCDWSWDNHTCSGSCNSNINESASLGKMTTENYTANAKSFDSNSFDKVINITGEFPVLSGTYNIGFVDAKIEIDPELEQEHDNEGCYFGHVFLDHSLLFYVEIKPKVKSLGELIRQINLYRSHLKDGNWIILTDEIEPSFIEILKSQEISVYQRVQEVVSPTNTPNPTVSNGGL